MSTDLADAADVAAGAGARTLRFPPTWRSFTSTQGGLLVGHLLAASARAAGARPRAVTAHLLEGVPADTDVLVTAEVERTGTTSSVRAAIRCGTRRAAVAQVLTHAGRDVPSREEPGPPVGPGVQDGTPFELPRDYVPVAEHLEIRALGRTRPLGGGDEPRLSAWVRVRAVLEPLVQLGVVIDALPPSLFAVRTAPLAMPTVELTAHLAAPAPPAGAWLRVDQWTVWHDDAVAVDDGELRTEDGVLVARSRQTRRLRRGR